MMENKSLGIDVEIIKNIYQQYGYQIEFYLLGYDRLIKEFNQGKYDFASPAAFSFPKMVFTLKSTYLLRMSSSQPKKIKS